MNERHLDVVIKLIKPTPIKQLRLTFVPKVEKIKPIAKIHRISGRNYKALNIVEKEAIIIARFGALDRTLPPINSCLAISKKFHIPYSTCQRTLRQFKESDSLVIKRRGAAMKLLTPQIQRTLLSNELL